MIDKLALTDPERAYLLELIRRDIESVAREDIDEDGPAFTLEAKLLSVSR